MQALQIHARPASGDATRAVRFLLRLCLGLCLGLRADPAPAAPSPPAPRPIASEVIENLYRLDDDLYSGAEPRGEAAFALLERLGIKTVVSVDGARPDVEAARRHGLRYAHLPLGYNGYGSNDCLRLSQAARTLPKPLFVHCHHGLHRGPAAAAVLAMNLHDWSPARAEAWLTTAGTSTHYPGLYATVRSFRQPTPETLERVGREFPEVASTPGLVEAMVDIDRAWENLKRLERSNYRLQPEHPDLVPSREANRIVERLGDAGRVTAPTEYGPRFPEELTQAAQRAQALAALLADPAGVATRPEDLARARQSLALSCASCHRQFRDRPRPAPSSSTGHAHPNSDGKDP